MAFALGEVGRLPSDERALSFDRAETLIRKYRSELEELWRGEAFPRGLHELVEEAASALQRAREAQGA